MMYDKAYNHILNSIPGSMSQKMAISSKNHDLEMRYRGGYKMGNDYDTEDKIRRTLYITSIMM